MEKNIFSRLHRKIVLIDTKLILEYPTNREENLKDFEKKIINARYQYNDQGTLW